MPDRWQHIHGSSPEESHSAGLEEAAYVAGWVLSCAAVLGVVLMIWEFNV